MKSYAKRIRALKRLALAGCVAAVAVPSSAFAMPQEGGLYVQPSQQQSQYTLPSSFRTEVQTPTAQTHQTRSFALPANWKPEVQTTAPVALRKFSPTPTVVHQVETVPQNNSHTLAIVLASIALAIALCSLAYATVRTSQIQRREAGPSH
jgi:hypothetical protein